MGDLDRASAAEKIKGGEERRGMETDRFYREPTSLTYLEYSWTPTFRHVKMCTPS